MSPGLVILVAIGIFAVLLVFLKWILDITWNHAGKAIEKRHRDAQKILSSGRVPADWIPGRMKRRKYDDPKIAGRIKRFVLRRLDGEIRYFDIAAPFETQEAKRSFLHAIRDVQKRWRETQDLEFHSIIDPDDHSVPGGPYRT